MENVPAQSLGPDRIGRFPYCRDNPAAGAVRVPAARTRPTRGAPLQRDQSANVSLRTHHQDHSVKTERHSKRPGAVRR